MLIQNLKWQAFFAGAMASACWLHYNAELYPQAALLGAAGLWGLFGPVPFLRGKTLHGSARWASRDDVKARGLLGTKGVIIGKLAGRFGGLDARFLRFDAPGHLATFAPTRSGKGAGQIIPTLLTYPGSVFVTDVKRENYDITATYRRDVLKQDVLKIDPNDASNSVVFNPLDAVRREPQYLATDAGMLADMMIARNQKGGGNSEHFEQQAYMVIKGFVMYVIQEHPDSADMAMVRRLLTASEKDLNATCKDMTECTNIDIAAVGNHLLSLSDREKSSVMSTVKGKTEIWSDRQVMAVTSGKSEIDFRDLKDRNISLYMVIPPEQLDYYKQFMRVVVGMALRAMTQNKKQPAHPVLFLLDEFPALGTMSPVSNAVGVAAGYGVRLWLFCQSMAQLEQHYGREEAENFIGNCTVRSFFGVADLRTAEYVSKLLGRRTVETQSHNLRTVAGGLAGEASGLTRNETSRELMSVDEVTTLDPKKQIVMCQGMRAILADKAFYFNEPHFKGRYGKWKPE